MSFIRLSSLLVLGCTQAKPVAMELLDAGASRESPRCAVSLGDLRPAKARFSPGERATLLVELGNLEPLPCTASLTLEVWHLDSVATPSKTTTVALAVGEQRTLELEWLAPMADFRGYFAKVANADGAIEVIAGLDVSSRPTVFPRMGYLSSFPVGQSPRTSQEIVRRLSQDFRIDVFQFYDWSFRHEALIERSPSGAIAASWSDLFHRQNSFATIRSLIDWVHHYGGSARAYVTAYAARENYERSGVSPAWGVYDSAAADHQVGLVFGPTEALLLFDPSNPGWQAKMVEQYADAVSTMQFDGVHIDQFGPLPTVYRAGGTPLELPGTFPLFLEAVKAGLVERVPLRAACSFNIVDGSVGGWAVAPVATSDACEILYSELWYTTVTYEQIRQYVEELRSLGARRPAVIAGYSNYREDTGARLESEDAVLSAGLGVSTEHPGYSGRGYVDRFGVFGQSIRWQLDVPLQSTNSLVFTYANATGQTALRTVFVDGVPDAQITFGSRPSWSDWSSDAWVQLRLTPGRHVIELRYADKDSGFLNLDRLTLGAFDFNSVLLQNAVLFASGATHIEIGDDVQALAHEYFPNRSKSLTPRLQVALTQQYSFITGHENLLFDADTRPANLRRSDLAVTSGQRLISSGAGGVWTAVRERGPLEVVHLVNLIGVDDDLWRNAAPPPLVQTDVVVRNYHPNAAKVVAVYEASPDRPQSLALTPLELRRGRDERGAFIEVTVPTLSLWEMLVYRTGA